MLLSLFTRLQTAYLGLRSRIEDENGAVATEYALLLVFVAIAIIAGATALGIAINDRLQDAADTVGPVAPEEPGHLLQSDLPGRSLLIEER